MTEQEFSEYADSVEAEIWGKSHDEILADCKAQGEDPEKIAAEFKELFLKVFDDKHELKEVNELRDLLGLPSLTQEQFAARLDKIEEE